MATVKGEKVSTYTKSPLDASVAPTLTLSVALRFALATYLHSQIATPELHEQEIRRQERSRVTTKLPLRLGN